MRQRLQIDTDPSQKLDQRTAGRFGNRLTARARVGASDDFLDELAAGARTPTRDANVAGRGQVGRLAGRGEGPDE